MPYQIHSQHLDLGAGFHIAELRDEYGNRHLVQLATGHDTCVACGSVHRKEGLEELDPRALINAVLDELNASHDSQKAYAKKHGITVK